MRGRARQLSPLTSLSSILPLLSRLAHFLALPLSPHTGTRSIHRGATSSISLQPHVNPFAYLSSPPCPHLLGLCAKIPSPLLPWQGCALHCSSCSRILLPHTASCRRSCCCHCNFPRCSHSIPHCCCPEASRVRGLTSPSSPLLPTL